MYVEQITDEQTGVCGYLIACQETRQAAVVHAFGELGQRLLERAEEEGFVLRYRLDTRLFDESKHYADPLGGLLGRLGVRVVPKLCHSVPKALAHVPRVGPVVREGSTGLVDAVVTVATPTGTVQLVHSVRSGGRAFLVGNRPVRPVDRVLLELGEGRLELVAVPGKEDSLCVIAPGVVITPERTSDSRPAMSPILAMLIPLPEDTLVYPRRVEEGGASVSTLAEQRGMAIESTPLAPPRREAGLRA